MLRIRLATFDDLPAILEISNHYARHTPANFAIEPEPLALWDEAFRATHEKYPWLVAEVFGRITGFAKASPWKGRCAYTYSAETTVYLHPDNLGRGVGRALYERLIDLMRRQGFHTAIGGITHPNPASVRLHESLGYRKVAHFEQVGWKYGAWHDVGYWQLILNTSAPDDHVRLVRDVPHEQ